MASFLPTSAQTLEDQRLYTRARLTSVSCLGCSATVGVKKNSEHHTSIQWYAGSQAQCLEFQQMDREPDGRHLHVPCSQLSSSIDRAVAEGELEIGALDGY